MASILKIVFQYSRKHLLKSVLKRIMKKIKYSLGEAIEIVEEHETSLIRFCNIKDKRYH